jgi:hypothetical protein
MSEARFGGLLILAACHMGNFNERQPEVVGTIFAGQSSSHVTMNVTAIYWRDCCTLKMVFETLDRFLRHNWSILNAI